MRARPEIAVGIVKNSEGNVLVVRRSRLELGKNNAQLLWAFPGGKKKRHESLQKAAKREVLEESGYQINPIRILSRRTHPEFPATISYVICDLLDIPPSKASRREVNAVMWASPRDLPALFTSDIDPQVKNYLGLI